MRRRLSSPSTVPMTLPSSMTGTYPNLTYTGDTNLDHIRIQPYVYAKQINGVTMTTDSVAKQVVVEGQYRLTNGARVRVAQPGTGAAG